MTTSPVMTVTDELLAEIAQELNRCKFSDDDDGDESWPSISGEAVSALTAELRRLREENTDLAQSLAESRANDQAAMGWLISLRWASGDRGERTLPDLVEHIEWLVKNAWRYRFVRLLDNDCFMINTLQRVSGNELDTAIDTAMQATQ